MFVEAGTYPTCANSFILSVCFDPEKVASRLKTVQSEMLRLIRQTFFNSLLETVNATFGLPADAQHEAGTAKLKDVKARLYTAWKKKVRDFLLRRARVRLADRSRA